MKRAFLTVIIVAITAFFTTGVYAGEWILYDNFDSYASIDELKSSIKWHISSEDEAIANFSIENGQLKIEHLAGNPDDSAWASLDHPARGRIIAIKATVTVQSWSGSVRTRIGAEYGGIQGNPNQYVWYSMELKRWPDSAESVRGMLNLLENDDWQHDLVYTELGYGKHPVLGIPYTLIAAFAPDRDLALFKVKEPNDLGEVRFNPVENITELNTPFRAIGTRSSDADGTCISYFDDIYVYVE